MLQTNSYECSIKLREKSHLPIMSFWRLFYTFVSANINSGDEEMLVVMGYSATVDAICCTEC